MDRLNYYRQIIETTLTGLTHIRYANPNVRNRAVFDRNSDNYLVMSEGWDNGYRVHHCLVHLELYNGKIWIQHDGLEDGIALALEQAGILKNDLVLGFQPPDVRPYTEYAAA